MTPEQRALYNTRMQIGQRFGVGGSQWRYYTVSGDGVSSDVTTTFVGTRQLSIIQTTAEKLGVAQPGQPVGTVAFQLNAPVDTDIATGGYLVSIADSTLVFSIAALDTLQGFPSGIVERSQLPT